jgi:uncharacterized protein YkwD
MSEHRRNRRYRKPAVVALVVAAVGVPSVALACVGGQSGASAGSYIHWKSASHAHAWASGHPWAKAGATAGAAATAKASAKPSATAPRAATTAAASAPASAAAPASAVSARVLALVNAARSSAGCGALTVNAKLAKAAQDHSQDMADNKTMSHTGSDGSSPGDRITRAGYNWSSYGENVAYGYTTPESVMAGWMSSPGHKANILDCGFKEIGVGFVQNGDYWTQDFATAR